VRGGRLPVGSAHPGGTWAFQAYLPLSE